MERTEAIEVIRKCWPVNRNGMLSDALETLIPELKESEDERVRKALLNEFIHLQSNGYKFAGLEGEEIIAYLEKQKEQNFEDIEDEAVRKYMKLDKFALANMLAERDKTNAEVIETFEGIEEQPAEWSEEDEKKIYFLSRLIEFQVKNDEYCFGDGRLISKQEAIEMLKSLRPQPRWKPSEEQIKALQMVKDSHCFMYQKDRIAIETLLEQLIIWNTYQTGGVKILKTPSKMQMALCHQNMVQE